MEIKKKTIEKLTKYLNELAANEGEFDPAKAQQLRKKHHVIPVYHTLALDLGYFDKIGSKKYRCRKVVYQPIDSRKVIEEFYKRWPSNLYQNKKKRKQVKINPVKYIEPVIHERVEAIEFLPLREEDMVNVPKENEELLAKHKAGLFHGNKEEARYREVDKFKSGMDLSNVESKPINFDKPKTKKFSLLWGLVKFEI